ncbi:hypothetical protein [Nocardia sp. NRRL S-836]|uniref:hypothetical protein n=1 Tax=Nocardia sp. NRRL S-836 TaxID=1519492 RepID=UPI0006ADDCA5|nr:hypothetical protein [Nocardia sp. NRRL S-836]KOV87229.1 hypothetical protein ADL03_07780 [Nocardia sp. NRRL S-836]
MDYRSMPLREQARVIGEEMRNEAPLTKKGDMWAAAERELPSVRDAFKKETNKAREAKWDQDAAGKQFVATSERGQKILDDWSERVTGAQPSAYLRVVASALMPTFDAVRIQVEEYNKALLLAMSSPQTEESLEALEIPFRIKAGEAMNLLAGYYRDAERTLAKIKGAPSFQDKKTGRNPGGPRAGGPTGGPDAGAQQSPAGGQEGGPEGGAAGGSEGGAAGGPEGGAAGGPEGGAGGGAAGGGPSLSGGVSAPPIPTPKLPAIPTPTLPPVSSPFIPPMVPGGHAGSALRPGGIGGTGGGRVPGVHPGGGIGGMSAKSSLPAASFGAPASAAPGGVAPTSAPLGGPAGGPAGAGGVPPMMPPMGGAGMGAGGAGNGPGSGAAQRRGNSRTRRRDGATPGLPSMLSGKAGRADANSFAVRGHRSAEPVVPATAHVVDEDLWRVDQWASSQDGAIKPRRLH